MNVKLSALAVGLTLAYGMSSAALADTASIEQIGNFNTAVIEQDDNNGDVSASIYTTGWGNDHSIYQEDSSRVWADINASGSSNTASITQEDLNYGGATVVQDAFGSNASVDQGDGYRRGRRGNDAESQWAFIYQNSGWGHDASI